MTIDVLLFKVTIFYLLEECIVYDLAKRKLKEFRYLLQIAINQKSIKITKDGKITIIYRFKPNEFLINNGTQELEKKLLDQLKAITNTKFKITRMQKEPSSCYNTYVRLFNALDSGGKDRVKRFLRYFEKTQLNTFVKKSYCEIHIFAQPVDIEEFNKFLFIQES